MSSQKSSVRSLPFLAIPSQISPSPSASPIVPHSPIFNDSPSQARPHNPIPLKPETPRQLLIPQFDRPLQTTTTSQQGVKVKHHKLIRHHKSRSHELLSAASHRREYHHTSIFSQFRVVPETKRIKGFQSHAVEKWLVERDLVSHPLTTVTVHTNDENDEINVLILAPPLFLSPEAAEDELQNAIYKLKLTGARPHETPDGIIMITSFSSFRADLNIVFLPDADYDTNYPQLFTNINLARMGCGGRSALTLELVPAATQEKFLALYAIPGSIPGLVGFNNVVIEFVRLVQAALVIFGLFPSEAALRDGLLCDLTVKGMQRWVHEIGEPYFRLEPMQAVLEPSAVAALLSLTATFRWRMYTLGASGIPKDPFHDPESAVTALMAFQKSQSQSEPVPYLSLPLLHEIKATHAKTVKSEPYKVHKAIMHRPEDFEVETMDIHTFVGGIVSAGKDGIDSLRFVWAGKARKERKKEKEKEEEKHTEGETDDVSEHIGKMLRKGAGNMHAIASGVVDGVKDGVKELGGLTKSRKGTEILPTFKITQSDPEPEPDAPPAPRSARSSLLGLPSASSSMSELERSKYFMFPSGKPGSIKSFKSAMTGGPGGSIELKPVLRRTQTEAPGALHERDEDESSADASPSSTCRDTLDPPIATKNTRRRWSLSDAQAFDKANILPTERMAIDVELCGQFVELRRKETKMRHAITIAEVTLAAVKRTNLHLERELAGHKEALDSLVPRAQHLQYLSQTYKQDAEQLNKNSQMLEYQLDRLEEGVKDMSRAVASGRNRVRALRGAARQIGGVHGLEEDSASDEEDEFGELSGRQGMVLGVQTVKKHLGSWLGVTKAKADRSHG